MLSVTCPQCNAAMTCDDSASGRYIQCYACGHKFVAGAPAPANTATPPPAIGAGANSKLLPVIAIIVCSLALIAALVSLALNIFVSPVEKMQFDFSKDAEDTAMAIFKIRILAAMTSPGKEGYFWQENGRAAISDAEVEVMQDGKDDKFVAVFIKTKAGKLDIRRYYLLQQNKDGYYVSCNKYTFEKEVDKKWMKEVEEKISKYEKDDESSEIE